METIEKSELNNRQRMFLERIEYSTAICRVARSFFKLGFSTYADLSTVLRIYGYDNFDSRRVADMFRLNDYELLEALQATLKEIQTIKTKKL